MKKKRKRNCPLFKYSKLLLSYAIMDIVLTSQCYHYAAPSVEVNNDKSKFVSQEIHKSDRPDLASARIVISGGMWMKFGPKNTHVIIMSFVLIKVNVDNTGFFSVSSGQMEITDHL